MLQQALNILRIESFASIDVSRVEPFAQARETFFPVFKVGRDLLLMDCVIC